jgi:hypothetical protein
MDKFLGDPNHDGAVAGLDGVLDQGVGHPRAGEADANAVAVGHLGLGG